MTLLGILGLIVLVMLGIAVLRVKSDPLENEEVRKSLADSKKDTPSQSGQP